MADRNQRKARKARKPRNKIFKRMQRKLWLVFGVVCILFVVLIGRIMYIQYVNGDKYEKIVLSQLDYDSTEIPFQRGNIIDSKGTVLATSIDVYNVILDCKVLNANSENIDSTVRALCENFDEIDESTVRNMITENPTSQYYVLAKKVSYEEMAAFEELEDSDTYKGKISGIWFEKEYVREYPYSTLGAATIGFATSGNLGIIGLEEQYSSVLNGVNGRTYGYLNSDSNLEQTTIEAENGNNIVLSIDVNIQTVVENAISDWNAQYEGEDGTLGSAHTAALVMNPNTGEVLAMAQYPTFDLNNPRDLSEYYSEEELEAMTEDEKLEKLNQIWQNFCVTYTYEPGSTAKPFTVACGLDTGTLTGNETYVCDGGEYIADRLIRCVNRNGHGVETIADALSNSCNDALMQMSYVIGPENFAEYQSLFGFGQKTFIDLPGETSTANLIYDEEGLESTVNLATNSFGQNFNTTMIQLGSAFCSLVNGGYLYQPHLVTEITDENGNVVEDIEPTLLKQTISSDTSSQIKDLLLNVVANGTGKTAGVDGYNIGGKTGTAEKQPRGDGNYLVSFIGFAPTDDPQVVVYVIVDEPNVEQQAHSTYAQEIAHDIFEQILPYMGVSSNLTEDEESAAADALTEAAIEETNSEDDSTDSTEGETDSSEETTDSNEGTAENSDSESLTAEGE